MLKRKRKINELLTKKELRLTQDIQSIYSSTGFTSHWEFVPGIGIGHEHISVS